MLNVVENAAKSLLYRDISAAIGNVPIVRLNRLLSSMSKLHPRFGECWLPMGQNWWMCP